MACSSLCLEQNVVFQLSFLFKWRRLLLSWGRLSNEIHDHFLYHYIFILSFSSYVQLIPWQPPYPGSVCFEMFLTALFVDGGSRLVELLDHDEVNESMFLGLKIYKSWRLTRWIKWFLAKWVCYCTIYMLIEFLINWLLYDQTKCWTDFVSVIW